MPQKDIVFTDVTSKLGLDQVYRNGEESDQFTYLEAMGGGWRFSTTTKTVGPTCFFWLAGRLLPIRHCCRSQETLYRNVQGVKLKNVSADSGTQHANYYSQGVAVGDVDNDGFADLLVTGYGGLDLFLNLGDGTFVESASTRGLVDPSWSTSAGFGDFDGGRVFYSTRCSLRRLVVGQPSGMQINSPGAGHLPTGRIYWGSKI